MMAFGGIVQSRAQRQAAEAYRRMALATIRAQEDAADRALVEMPYSGRIYPPPIEKRNGKWFAIIETGASVPKIARPKAEGTDPR